jgi:hypothetical protein
MKKEMSCKGAKMPKGMKHDGKEKEKEHKKEHEHKKGKKK